MNKPAINVTPLIDVLLVLLIIFMVVAPLKPSSLKARIPAEPSSITDIVDPHPDTLIVTVAQDGSLRLNKEKEVGTTADAIKLIERLQAVFAARIAHGNVSATFADDPQRPMSDRIERTVFIKAPRSLDYGSVARVVDVAKQAGAFPISLQIDNLDN